jgi:hypothetical protein
MNVRNVLHRDGVLRRMRRAKAKSPRCQLRWHRPPFSKGVSNPLVSILDACGHPASDHLVSDHLASDHLALNHLALNQSASHDFASNHLLPNQRASNPMNPYSMPSLFPPLKKGGRGDLLFRPLRHG